MADKLVFRPPPEPAHVSIIRQYEDLVTILKLIREVAQEIIDQGFDRVSSQIGFVVTTTIPVTAEVSGQGLIKELVLRGEHLKGTLFENELLPALKEVLHTSVSAHKGKYDFYLIWFDALKLKLGRGAFRPPPEPAHSRCFSSEVARTEIARLLGGFRPPPEPAHYHFPEEFSQIGREAATTFLGRFRPPPEPAHWFDPGRLVTEAEQVFIVALDEVYPELRLVDRISASRLEQVALNPQPLPPKALEDLASLFSPSPEPWKEFQEALIKLVTGPRPEPWREKMLAEVMEVIRKYRCS
jgi:hypothetical protein